MFSRSLARSFCVDDNDLEDGKSSKERESSAQLLRLPKIQNQALLSGLAYCVSSCSMILVNKFVLSGYAFNAPVFLMLYQVYYWCLLSISHATQLCACLKASFSCSVTAEHCISDYSFYTIPVRCCSN
jgi:hypothetical protein